MPSLSNPAREDDGEGDIMQLIQRYINAKEAFRNVDFTQLLYAQDEQSFSFGPHQGRLPGRREISDLAWVEDHGAEDQQPKNRKANVGQRIVIL